MSIAITSRCWPLRMPPTPKAVLMALADHANDQGQCWPSITTLCERTCFSRRAVIQAIAWLELASALTADRSNGRSTSYSVTPEAFVIPVHLPHGCTSSTGASGAQTRAPPAPDPCTSRTGPVHEMHPNRKEPSRTIEATVKKNSRSSPVAKPDGVKEQTWADWLTLRKAKSAPVTETVLKEATAEAGKAGMSLERFLGIWCARGSQGLQADWLRPNERAGPTQPIAKPSIAANFRGKEYAGTSIDDLPDHLRPTGTDG